MLGVVGPTDGAFTAEEALALTQRIRPGDGAHVDYGALLRQMIFHPGKAARGLGDAPVLQRAASRMANGARIRRKRGTMRGGTGGQGAGQGGALSSSSSSHIPRPPSAPSAGSSSGGMPGSGSGNGNGNGNGNGRGWDRAGAPYGDGAIGSGAGGSSSDAMASEAARARAAVDAAVRRGEKALEGMPRGAGDPRVGGEGPSRDAPAVGQAPPGVPLGASHVLSLGDRLHAVGKVGLQMGFGMEGGSRGVTSGSADGGTAAAASTAPSMRSILEDSGAAVTSA